LGAARNGENFNWFVNNDRGGRQHLRAIAIGEDLPTLVPNAGR
jgi:hypothetical protein